jgi:hypothetical protein
MAAVKRSKRQTSDIAPDEASDIAPDEASDIADPAGVNFVRVVHGLYHKPDLELLMSLPEADREQALSVANALTVLWDLVTEEQKRLRESGGRIAATRRRLWELVHAEQFLECLTEGGAGPGRRYIAHLGSVIQAKAPNRIEMARRELVVGVVLAIETAAKSDGVQISRRQAINLVLWTCPFIAPSRDIVKGWLRRSTARAHFDRDFVLRAARETAQKQHPSLPFYPVVLERGMMLLVELFSTQEADAEVAREVYTKHLRDLMALWGR